MHSESHVNRLNNNDNQEQLQKIGKLACVCIYYNTNTLTILYILSKN